MKFFHLNIVLVAVVAPIRIYAKIGEPKMKKEINLLQPREHGRILGSDCQSDVIDLSKGVLWGPSDDCSDNSACTVVRASFLNFKDDCFAEVSNNYETACVPFGEKDGNQIPLAKLGESCVSSYFCEGNDTICCYEDINPQTLQLQSVLTVQAGQCKEFGECQTVADVSNPTLHGIPNVWSKTSPRLNGWNGGVVRGFSSGISAIGFLISAPEGDPEAVYDNYQSPTKGEYFKCGPENSHEGELCTEWYSDNDSDCDGDLICGIYPGHPLAPQGQPAYACCREAYVQYNILRPNFMRDICVV